SPRGVPAPAEAGGGACGCPESPASRRFARAARCAGVVRGAGMASKQQDGVALPNEMGWPEPGGRRRAAEGTSGAASAEAGAGSTPRWAEGVRRAWPQASGPLITLAATLLLELQVLAGGSALDLGGFLVIAVVYSAFLGGMRAGLASAAIMVV